ncbi:hypothetical protein GUITHDRAFT_117954 [Guillardia theta CCMP2712]|uniref:Uncharacterized protein n=1 Tax=Guillardia theta (strain CCMP2712) TaxID=905079 RepID=L1II49_GUITC|nr:hypothetical protein GUITHDRAFT_117954 [Guillardia theta CCMP2712]EKX35923.1 hypothetical protein GUITHDRAFT_117954 [Guillardia theta CCMP2712]|eukprot:XP_005822903.1 hypothetical protein GUITHDRAFT_117954 [Guillardia theta CCMP2712]
MGGASSSLRLVGALPSDVHGMMYEHLISPRNLVWTMDDAAVTAGMLISVCMDVREGFARGLWARLRSVLPCPRGQQHGVVDMRGFIREVGIKRVRGGSSLDERVVSYFEERPDMLMNPIHPLQRRVTTCGEKMFYWRARRTFKLEDGALKGLVWRTTERRHWGNCSSYREIRRVAREVHEL